MLNLRQSNDREASRRWALDLLARSDWAVLDTETTGLDGAAEAVQIAIVAPDGATLLDTLVRPTGPIPPDATAVHGITDAIVASAPSFRELYRTLRDVLRGRTIIAYNAAFDRRILRQTALHNEVNELPLIWQCAMEQYARFVGQWSDRRGSYAWQKLPRRPEYDQQRHQAIVDCLATLDVLHRMAGA